MKTLLVISASRLESDPRVMRQLHALVGRYRITACGYSPPDIEGVEFLPMTGSQLSFGAKVIAGGRLLAGCFDQYYWSRPEMRALLASIRERQFDAILANDAAVLPLAVKMAREQHARLVFDAHEYAPRELEDNIKWRVFFQRYNDWICRTFLREVDAMMTVCDGIADTYAKEYGVAPVVVSNAPAYEDLMPQPVDPQHIRIIHHGGASPSRRIELMIDLVGHLEPRFYLDLMLMPNNQAYLAKLRRQAAGNARIRFVDPVPMPGISRFINRYDIGLFLLPFTNFNYKLALPNKFFEFVQGRLAVAIGPSPEMRRLTERHGFGVVSGDFEPRTLASLLNQLGTDDIMALKWRAHAAASVLSAERNRDQLVALVTGDPEKASTVAFGESSCVA